MTKILLKKIRDSGQTVTDIARGARVPQSVLWRWINGQRRNLTLQTVEKLCDYFNLELRERNEEKMFDPATRRPRKRES